MTVQGNGGTLAVTHKATVLGYKQDLWFRKYYITNIIALKNLIKQYQLTYSSTYQIFVVNREDQEKPNMETFEKITEEFFFKQNLTKDIKLDLNKFILLDNCPTMDLF